MHYYQHNISDYRADTGHLSLLEHGVYRQLMDWYYLNESCIQAETEVVFRRLSARTEEERSAVLVVLSEFFVAGENGYSHRRCDAEISSYKAKAERARSNGKLGGRPKETKAVSSGLAEETQTKANYKPLTNNQESTNTDVLVVVSDAAADLLGSPITKAKQIPNCPHETLLALYAECLPTLPQPRAWEGVSSDNLRARWRWVLTATGRNTGKRYATTTNEALEWFRRFFDYVGGSDFLMGRKADWQADIRWLVKATNFDKVLSGAYENERATA